MSDSDSDSDSPTSKGYIPQVADEKKPKPKQEFGSIEEAFNFYNEYAREYGFSARMSNSRRKKGTNEIVWKQFVCSKEGETNKFYQNKCKELVERSGERRRGVVRVGCKAKMTLVKRQTGPNWIVSTFVEEHNHVLTTPDKIHLLRSHRNISAAKRVLSQQVSEVNIPTCQQIRVMEIESGGAQNMGCTKKDIINYEQRLRDEHKEVDAETLVEFFSMEKEKNPAFYFEYDLDETNRLSKCFWADSYARRSYNFFGDVIVFNTIYNTNKYDMIFAPIIGVNHHGQTIIFGCAFLSDEKTESFVWLFNKLLDAMPKGAPQVIITDQDSAMTKAISEVLPLTVHRYCIWHILNKFSEKLGAIVYRDNYRLFKNVILNSETEEEFDASWLDLLKRIDLEDNAWLCHLYEIRSKWIPAYGNMHFSAGMSSIQRAESSHSFFKKYVSRKNALMDFITRFNRAVGHQRHEELIADFNDMNEQPKLTSLWPMETQMMNIYTKTNFLSFQKEMFESTAYILSCTLEDDEAALYTVQRVDETSSSRHRHLTFRKQSNLVSCSCRQFHFKGIPCRHMLAYFRFKQIIHLPSEYILTRWTKSAKVGGLVDYSAQGINDQQDKLLMRHAQLSQLASMVVDDACLTVECTNILLDELELVHKKIKEMNNTHNVVGESIGKASNMKAKSISNRTNVRSKGCGKRLKSSKEMAISSSRLCRGCGQREQSHDKRNCPKLHERSTMDDLNTDLESMDDEDSSSQAGSNFHGLSRRL